MHGSQVTGKIHGRSDLDIAVMPKKSNTKVDVFKLYGDLSHQFKTDHVDLVNLGTANPLLMYSVARKNKLLAGKIDDFNNFLSQAFCKYNNYKPYLKMEAEFVKERVLSYANN